MTAFKYKNRVKVALASAPGLTGDFMLGAPEPGFRSFDPIDDQDLFDITVVDGVDWEVRSLCLYSSPTNSLTRGSFRDSSTGSALNLSEKAVIVNDINAEKCFPYWSFNPSSGDTLKFNGYFWYNFPDEPPLLSALGDCNINNPQDGEVLVYDSTTFSWQNKLSNTNDAKKIVRIATSNFGQQIMFFIWNDNKITSWGTSNNIFFNSVLHEVQFPSSETGIIADFHAQGQTAYCLFSTGNLYAWGDNTFGQYGILADNQSSPILVATNVQYLHYYDNSNGSLINTTPATYNSTMYYMNNAGQLFGTGGNTGGQLVNGTTTSVTTWTEILPPAGEAYSYIYVSAPVVSADGTECYHSIWCDTQSRAVYASGYNGNGQLGIGNSITQTSWQLLFPSTSPPIVNILCDGNYTALDVETNTSISIPKFSTQFLTDRGDLFSCGDNSLGQLGNGTFINSEVPVTTLEGTFIKKVIKAPCSVYVINGDDSFSRWGCNEHYALGDGTTTNSNVIINSSVMEGESGIPVLDCWTCSLGQGFYSGDVAAIVGGHQYVSVFIRRSDGVFHFGYNPPNNTTAGIPSEGGFGYDDRIHPTQILINNPNNIVDIVTVAQMTLDVEPFTFVLYRDHITSTGIITLANTAINNYRYSDTVFTKSQIL